MRHVRSRRTASSRRAISCAVRWTAESLESRVLLSSVSWTGGGDAISWTDPANWSGHALPGVNDDVTIDIVGHPAVTLTGQTTASIHSLISNDPITVGNALLSVATTAQLGANISLGGRLQGGTWSFTGGAKLITTSTVAELISVIAINGDIDCATFSSRLVVDDGLTLNGTLSLGSASGSTFGQLLFGGATTAAGTLDGTGAIVMGGAGSNLIESASGLAGPQAFTIGPNIIVSGKNGSITSLGVNDTIVNQGTINANVAAGTFSMLAGITNQGSIQANNGGVLTAVNLTNQTGGAVAASSSTFTLTNLVNQAGATVTVTNSALTLKGSLSNLGTISATNSTVNLAGDFSQADLGTFNRTGGTVNVTGVLRGDLTLDAATGSWNLSGGTLQDGNVIQHDSVELGFTSQGALLFNKTINGDLNMTLGQGAYFTVVGSLTLNGTLRLGNAAGSTSGTVYFGTGGQQFNPGSSLDNSPPGVNLNLGNASLQGNATVIFGSSSGNRLFNQTLVNINDPNNPLKAPPVAVYPGAGINHTDYYVAGGEFSIASTVTIQGIRGDIVNSYNRGSVRSAGTIIADGANAQISVGGTIFVGVVGNSFFNTGSVQVTNGGNAALGGLLNTGTVTVSGSGLTLFGTVQNSSTITATNSAVYLSCTFTQAQLGIFSRVGSIVELTGVLTGGLVLDDTTGSWDLHGGTVLGGSINESGSAELAFTSYGGMLDGVTINGIMDMAGIQNNLGLHGAYVQVLDNLVLNGTAYLGDLLGSFGGGGINFGNNLKPAGSLTGTGTVVFGGASWPGDFLGNNSSFGSKTLTIGAGITIRGKNGYLNEGSYPDSKIVIAGTVSADVSGGEIHLGSGNGFIYNQGVISAVTGGTVVGNSLLNPLGHTISANGAALTLTGNWSNSGVISVTGSSLNLQGTVTRSAIGTVVRNGGFVNIMGTIVGGFNLNAASGSWRLLGGKVVGGVINTTGGAAIVLTSNGGTIDSITLNGDIDAKQDNPSTAYVYGGLILNGRISLGNAAGTTSGQLYFVNAGINPVGSVTGNGAIQFGGGSNSLSNYGNQPGAAGTLTFGPNITIRGTNGFFGNVSGTSTLAYQGRVMADGAGGTIQTSNGIGNVTVQGSIQATAGNIRNNGPLTVIGQGTLTSTWPATVQVGGSLTGASTGSAGSDLRGIVNLSGGTAASPASLEAMSRDVGAVAAGFDHNFAFGTLALIGGAYMKAVDQFDNAAGAGTEAIYANAVVVQTFATLDLNGLHLYTRAAQIDGHLLNGSITVLPDGGPLALDAPLPGAISPAGNTDSWTFFGHAGEVITAYVNPGAGSAPGPVSPTLNFVGVQLLSPTNQLLASGSSGGFGAPVGIGNMALPTDGTYTIQVSASPAHPTFTGNYEIAVWDVTTHVAAVSLGQTTNGALTNPFSVDQWNFSALAGEQVKFHLVNATSQGFSFTLTGPNGFTGFSNISGDSALVNLPSAGVYSLSVSGINGATGSYAFQINPTSVSDLPLNGAVNGAFAGPGQAELHHLNVPAVQTLIVNLDDNTNTDVNELYLRFGSPPTRETYDYRYSSASAADQRIIVPSAAIGDWYVLIYSGNVPSPSTYSLAANGYTLRLLDVTPATLGNAAPATLSISGAGFEPGTTATLVGPGAAQYPGTVSVVSFTQLTATFPASLPAGTYSVRIAQGSSTDTLHDAFTVTQGGSAQFETSLELPGYLGRHQPATIYIKYANSGTVAMPAPLLVLQSNDPLQKPLLTLDSTKISQGLWSSTIPDGYGTSISLLASGKIPGVLLPGEIVSVPVYYAGLLRPWDTSHTDVPMSLGTVKTTNTSPVDWNSMKAQLKPADLPAGAWDQLFANLTGILGNTWGQFVAALDNNVAYLGGLGKNVQDVNTLWTFMYQQANDAIGPFQHQTSVTDAALSLPGGATLGFWRNYHRAISGRYTSGMLGFGWSVPYQSTINIEADGSVDLHTVGEPLQRYQSDSRGGYFNPGDGTSLVANGDGTYTFSSQSGESDTYGVDGKLSFHADTNGNRINFLYNGTGQLVTLQATSGQSLTLGYYPTGLLASLTGSDGRVTTYGYDPSNQFLTTVQNIDGTTTYGFDTANHLLQSIQHHDGTRAFFTYDANQRLSGISSEEASLALSYEQPGEVTGTDALNHVTRAFYDEMGMLAKAVDPLGDPVSFGHDAHGNVNSMTDATGDSYSYAYDAAGNLTGVTDPLHGTTTYTYGAFGHITSVTDGNNNKTTYAFDARGNMSNVTYADGTRETFSFNPNGEPLSFVNRNGQTTGYAFDGSGRLTKETFADSSHYDYTYDAFGNLLTATDSGGTTTFTYSVTDKITSVTYPGGKSLTFTYDAADRRATMTDQSAYKVKYVYDSAGRLWKLTDAADVPIATYAYDAMGRLLRRDNGNGTYTTYQRDAAGNLLHLINFAPGGGVNSRFDYSYNLLNQAVSMATLDGAWSYSYDAGGQLTRAVFTSINPSIPNQDLAYHYDPVGNRTSTVINGVATAYVANSLNQYTSVGATLRQYDLNGNLIQDGATTYSYNQLNQMTGINGPAGIWQLTYNALGQRVASTFNGQTTQYLTDPTGLKNVVSEYDGAGTLAAHFNYGVGLVSRTAPAGASNYYDFDLIGSTAGLSDATGAYVNQYSYLPFGQTLSSSGTVANPFQFGGGLGVETDSPDLLHMRARQYAPSTGAFLTADPLGLLAGNTNFYTYAYNQPIQFVDPSGLVAGPGSKGGQSVWNLKKVQGPSSAFIYPPSAVEYQVPESTSIGILTDTGKSIVKDLEEGHVPSVSEVVNTFTDNAVSKLDIGPIPLGALEVQLIKPETALQVVQAINALKRQAACGTINGYETAALVAIGEASEGCEDAPGLLNIPFPPTPDQGDVDSGIVRLLSALDPNDKVGPGGFGPNAFVNEAGALPYRIDFENSFAASAPAQQVTITDKLSASLDWGTLRFTEIGWGDLVLAVPADSQHYQTTVSMTYNGKTFEVLVQVGINLVTGLITARFLSIDPLTDLPPDVLTGFLPPEDGTGRGKGYVSYTVNAKPNLPTGTQIRNIAQVSFDGQQIIATDQVSEQDPAQGTDPNKEALITIDSGAPTSSVQPLPSTETTLSFTVNWTGQDDPGGSGIASYSVFVSDNGGAFLPWLSGSTATSAVYTGVSGHTYAFYSTAVDNVGNAQGTPMGAQTQTVIVTQLPPSLSSTVIGDGTAQRSAFNSFTLVFNQVVTLSPGAITLSQITTNSAHSIVSSTPAAASDFTITNPSGDGKIWVVKVATGGALDNGRGDFKDGVYQFTLHSALITNASGAPLAGGDQTQSFRKLYGDINGDGRVNSLDYFQFSSAFGSRSTDARYRGLFDYNHDGRINSVDYFQFSTNFGKFLFLPA